MFANCEAGKSPISACIDFSAHGADPDTLKGCYHNERRWVDCRRWGITARRAGMDDQAFEEESLDPAVSVSVTEHLPTVTGRAAIRAPRRSSLQMSLPWPLSTSLLMTFILGTGSW